MNKLNWQALGAITTGIVIGTGAAWAVPPPPPGDGGGIKPPDAPPPGKIYFEDNVVIVGPGFVKPEADSGTVYVDLTKHDPTPVNPDKTTSSGKTVNEVVREVSTIKSQVEAETVALPRGFMDPATLMAFLKEDDLITGRGVFDDPAFLHEEVGGSEPAAPDRTEQARSGGAEVKAAPDAPAVRGSGAGLVIPSYWQLPLR